MKIIKQNQTLERKNSEICIVTEYPVGDETLDFAIVKISGRYPAQGYAVNNKCKEIVYVQEGEGEVFINFQIHQINAGDVILVEAGEKFYWNGHLRLHISCRPAFSVEQHQLVSSSCEEA